MGKSRQVGGGSRKTESGLCLKGNPRICDTERPNPKDYPPPQIKGEIPKDITEVGINVCDPTTLNRQCLGFWTWEKARKLREVPVELVALVVASFCNFACLKNSGFYYLGIERFV